ncbi:MAG: universal stress protein [Pirellulaceae bacterium]
MNVKKILFPTDFSHTGDAALEMATALARDSGATLIIAHVEESPNVYAGGEFYYGIPNPPTDELRRMLDEVKPTDPSVAYEHRLLTGDPAATIVRLAEEEGVDMIVLGTHGRTGILRMLMGSVAEAIVRRAKCPVLTYKHLAKSTAAAH